MVFGKVRRFLSARDTVKNGRRIPRPFELAEFIEIRIPSRFGTIGFCSAIHELRFLSCGKEFSSRFAQSESGAVVLTTS